MMNMKKAVKGLAFLACLGFFAFAGTAYADSQSEKYKSEKTKYAQDLEKDKKNVTDNSAYDTCPRAKSQISMVTGCDSQYDALINAYDTLERTCANNPQKNDCMKGKDTSGDRSEEYARLRQVYEAAETDYNTKKATANECAPKEGAYNTCMQMKEELKKDDGTVEHPRQECIEEHNLQDYETKCKDYASALSQAERTYREAKAAYENYDPRRGNGSSPQVAQYEAFKQADETLKTCKKNMEQRLSNAKTELNACKRDDKSDNKANEEYEEAQEKVEEILGKLRAAGCQQQGNTWVGTGESNNKKCADLNQKLVEAQNRLDEAERNKNASNQGKDQRCGIGEAWDSTVNGCVANLGISEDRYNDVIGGGVNSAEEAKDMLTELYRNCMAEKGASMGANSAHQYCKDQAVDKFNEMVNAANEAKEKDILNKQLDSALNGFEAAYEKAKAECEKGEGAAKENCLAEAERRYQEQKELAEKCRNGDKNACSELQSKYGINTGNTALSANGIYTAEAAAEEIEKLKEECAKYEEGTEEKEKCETKLEQYNIGKCQMEGSVWDPATKTCATNFGPGLNTRKPCPTSIGSTPQSIGSYIACRITNIVYDLRLIVYALAGFGMIAFAYAAIFGKINFRQLGNIGIGLFILSMTTSIIEYIAYDGAPQLQFRDHLPDGDHKSLETSALRSVDSGLAEALLLNCDNDLDKCPDAALLAAGEGVRTGWGSWEDIKNAINSAKDAIQTAANAYSNVKNTVNSVTNAAQNIIDAITGSSDAVRQAEKDLETAKNIQNQAQTAVNNAQEKVDNAQKNFDEAQSKVNDLTNKINEERAEIDCLTKALNRGNMTEQLEREEENLGIIEEECSDEKLKEGLDLERPAQRQRYEEAKAQCENRKKAAQDRIDAQKSEIEKCNQCAANMSDEEIRARINELQLDLDDDLVLLSGAQAELNAAQAELNGAQSELNNAQSILNQANAIVGQAEQNLENAQDNAGDWLDRLNSAASNANSLMNSLNTGSDYLLGSIGQILNDYQSATSTTEQNQYREQLIAAFNELASKCASGNCSENEIIALQNIQNMIQNNSNGITSGYNDWLNNDGAGGGSTISDALDQLSSIMQSASGVTSGMESANSQGNAAGDAIGGSGSLLGDILGTGMAIGEGITGGTDAYNQNQQNGNFDFTSEQERREEECRKNNMSWNDLLQRCE